MKLVSQSLLEKQSDCIASRKPSVSFHFRRLPSGSRIVFYAFRGKLHLNLHLHFPERGKKQNTLTSVYKLASATTPATSQVAQKL